MKKKSKDNTTGDVSWVHRLKQYCEQGLLTAEEIWEHDSVAAYIVLQEAQGSEVAVTLSESTTRNVSTILKGLAKQVAENLHQLDAADRRLSKSQKDNVLRAQARNDTEIPDGRKKELVEYASKYEPMTDAELRKRIIKKRIGSRLSPLTEDEIVKEIRMSNSGGCSMWHFDVTDRPATMAGGDTWDQERLDKGPQSKAESIFLRALMLDKERRKMNAHSVELQDDNRKIVLAAETAVRKLVAKERSGLAVGAPLVAIVGEGTDDMVITVNGEARSVSPDCLAVLVRVVHDYNNFIDQPEDAGAKGRPRHLKIIGEGPSGPRIGCILGKIIQEVIPDRVKGNIQILTIPSLLFRCTVQDGDTSKTFAEMLGKKGHGTHHPILFRTK